MAANKKFSEKTFMKDIHRLIEKHQLGVGDMTIKIAHGASTEDDTTPCVPPKTLKTISVKLANGSIVNMTVCL